MGLVNYGSYQPKHLSYSTINSYRSCGKRLYLEKIAKVEQIPGLAAIGGNAVHTASEVIDHYIWEHGFEGLTSEATITLDIQRNDNR